MKKVILLIILQLVLIKVDFSLAAIDESSVVNIKDTLTITVLDNVHLNTTAVVLEDGFINFPLIGSVYVKGRKVKDVQDEITKRLGEGYIKYPVVSVRLTRGIEALKIYLYGEVQLRGALPFDEKLTVFKALSLAGGILPTGRYGTVKVRRKVKSEKKYENIAIDIEALLDENSGEDILLKPDDILIVEPNKTFIVEGEVNRPMEYPLRKGMTVSRALAEAGGRTSQGMYGIGKVVRRNINGDGYQHIEIDFEAILNENRGNDVILQPDDVVVVEPNRRFIVEGQVNRPGEFPLKKGMTVIRALSEAGGIVDRGRYGKISVRRKHKEDGEYKDEKIFMGRGLENSKNLDMLLQPDDVVTVEPNDKFYIYGEVNRVGQFDLERGLTAFTALSLSGGLTKWGSQNQVKILRHSKEENNSFTIIKVNIEDVIKGDASADVFLEPGDIIIVSSGIF